MASKATARKAPAHPSTWDMLKGSILGLKDRSGSSRQSINKYIQTNYRVTMNDQLKSVMKRTLSKAVKDGKLVMNKGSFKLSAEEKKPVKPKKVVKKPKAKTTITKKAAKPKSVQKTTATKSAATKAIKIGTKPKPSAAKKLVAKKKASAIKKAASK